MADQLPKAVVEAALMQMGLLPRSARRAAADGRIVWSVEALKACQHEITTSRALVPAAALWTNYLDLGLLPQLPKSAPTLAPAEGAYEGMPCPICKGDLSVCGGVHGVVATMQCWQCRQPMNVCRGACQPAMPKVRRTTRNKRKEDAA